MGTSPQGHHIQKEQPGLAGEPELFIACADSDDSGTGWQPIMIGFGRQNWKRAASVCAAACLVCAVPAQGRAQESRTGRAKGSSLRSLSLAELGNVRVTTVSKQPEQVWHTPAAIYVLTHEDIERSSATTIPELLRLIPGVQVSRMQTDQWAVGIRGFASQFSKGLLVLIDGRSVYTPLFEGVYWDVQDLPFEDIDRIEVIRGPGGTIWGANAVNGVINIITKRARESQGVRVSARGGGQVDHFVGVAQAGFAPRKDFQFRIYAKGFDRGPELNPGHAAYDDWHQERGGLRADWEPDARDRVSLQSGLYKGSTGMQTAVAEFFPPSQIVSNEASAVSGGYAMVRWDRVRDAGSDFYLQAYFDRTNRQTAQFGETRDTFDVDFIDHIASLPRQDWILGAGVRESPSFIIQNQATVDFAPHHLMDYIYSGFAQDTVRIVPNHVSVVLGSKFEDNNYSGFGVEPSARILWNPGPRQALWGAVARALRIPGRVDQDLTLLGNVSATPPMFLQIEGNPGFKNEVLIGWEAGYRQLLTHNLYVDVAAFHNEYDNLEGYGPIAIGSETQPYPYTSLNVQFVNAIRGMTDGLEIAPDWKPRTWLELRGNYSHLHLQLHDKRGFADIGNDVETYQGSSPDHSALAQMLLSLPHGIGFDSSYRYVSALPAQQVNAYQTADAHLSWKFERHYRLEMDGRNLLQPAHREFAGDNGNPVGIRRSFYGGIAWIR